MDIVDANKSGKSAASTPRKRRPHAEEFKQTVVDACRVPGASLSGVALKYGVNANLARRWCKERPEGRQALPPALLPVSVCDRALSPTVAPTASPIEIGIQSVRIIVPAHVDAGTLREVLKAVSEVHG
ncbi:transposase [Eleftheria terrae]|uniref:transposase n=1 Tax=Eleftheria terrae TaxID=1597781 RepID=UPI00263A7744|nr:transposase [Eleftheria terrae]WKB50735.1 transposase [Eleftheria terrae]